MRGSADRGVPPRVFRGACPCAGALRGCACGSKGFCRIMLGMPRYFNKLLLIANPAAQNGAGRAGALRAEALLASALGRGNVGLRFTERANHATDLAEGALQAGFDFVVALGGDGAANEVANGLMRVPAATRPAFGLLPVGSGNDYARTLGMAKAVDDAALQLIDTPFHALDVGKCNDRWFVETLSFGLDAAIALDTVDRRVRTGKTGTMLYVRSGIDQLLHHLDACRYEASFDGAPFTAGCSYLFAVQLGKTYGGGFTICPTADAADGLFDVCIAHPPLSRAAATVIFLLAKNGRHTGFKQIELRRARSLALRFEKPLAVQIDGERLSGTSFDISIEPGALRVAAPSLAKGARS